MSLPQNLELQCFTVIFNCFQTGRRKPETFFGLLTNCVTKNINSPIYCFKVYTKRCSKKKYNQEQVSKDKKKEREREKEKELLPVRLRVR